MVFKHVEDGLDLAECEVVWQVYLSPQIYLLAHKDLKMADEHVAERYESSRFHELSGADIYTQYTHLTLNMILQNRKP